MSKSQNVPSSTRSSEKSAKNSDDNRWGGEHWDGTEWKGSAELWADPLGDQVEHSDCSVRVLGDGVEYTWTHKGKEQAGSIRFLDHGIEFQDTWHQAVPMRCEKVENARGLFVVLGSYGPDGEWGWRIGLYDRQPTGELVIQMTNIAPWGEEGRAVRMTCQRA